jgi:ABC-type oligopeptide transport system ATPase subunit
MHRGKIVEVGNAEEITLRPQHAYTRTLLASTPELASLEL